MSLHACGACGACYVCYVHKFWYDDEVPIKLEFIPILRFSANPPPPPPPPHFRTTRSKTVAERPANSIKTANNNIKNKSTAVVANAGGRGSGGSSNAKTGTAKSKQQLYGAHEKSEGGGNGNIRYVIGHIFVR